MIFAVPKMEVTVEIDSMHSRGIFEPFIKSLLIDIQKLDIYKEYSSLQLDKVQ